MNFIFSKNEDFIIRIIEVKFWKSPLRVKKTVCFQNKRANNNLETLWYILKKTDTLLEILLLKDFLAFVLLAFCLENLR